PAFHGKRIAEFAATMASCADAVLARWDSPTEPFDVAGEMMALTLDIISRTMFSTAVSGEVAAIRRLTDIVVNLRPSILDLAGLPEWIPRRQPRRYRKAIAAYDALVARF